MNTTTDQTKYAALIGLDWADQKHDVCLLVPGQTQPERLVLANTLEAISPRRTIFFTRRTGFSATSWADAYR